MFALIWLIPSVRSQVIMGGVSWYESFRVLGRDEGLKIEFTLQSDVRNRELDWYSKMLLFNNFDLPFSRLGLDGEGSLDLSIYYTFGDFNKGRSIIYDIESPYNNAFYGAYVVKLKPESPLDEKVDLYKLAEAVTRYDYSSLILAQLGLDHKDAYFKPESESMMSNVSRFGFDGWLQNDSKVVTRSVAHQADGFHQHYIQFGRPNATKDSEDFPETILFGRTYSKYFEEEALYVIFYILAGNHNLIETTDEALLSNSRVIMD